MFLYIDFRVSLSLSLSLTHHSSLLQLEQWVAQSHRLNEHYSTITAQLAPVIAAADVIIMDKSNPEYLRLFESADNMRRHFAPLNPAQIYRILELFSPDRVSPNPVPAAMRSAVRIIAPNYLFLSPL